MMPAVRVALAAGTSLLMNTCFIRLDFEATLVMPMSVPRCRVL